MPTKKPLADPLVLAEWRQIEDLRPGHWMWVEYIENETGRHFHRWAEITTVMSGQNTYSGRKIVRIYGNDTAGYGVDFMQYRGFGVQRLTAAQGKRCGLVVPDEPEDETDG
jgi:hypothetical protein